jgi:hypothetical protein
VKDWRKAWLGVYLKIVALESGFNWLEFYSYRRVPNDSTANTRSVANRATVPTNRFLPSYLRLASCPTEVNRCAALVALSIWQSLASVLGSFRKTL